MQVQKTIFIAFKSVLYILLTICLFVLNEQVLQIVSALILAALGVLSYLYGSSNKAIELIAKRNYLIAITCILFAVIMLFSQKFFFGVNGVLAIFLVILAGLQITSVLLTGISNARDNLVLKIARFAIPLFAIIPAGLILGGYFNQAIGPNGNEIVLGCMFVGAAIVNFLFISNQRKLKYTVDSDGDH